MVRIYSLGGHTMRETYDNDNKNHTDLNVYQCGMEDCYPGYSYGPAVRDHYIIHYIHKGEGIFSVGDRTYHLQRGQGFLICPGVITYYEADACDPWTYYWVGFHGIKAEFYLKSTNLTLKNPIFTYEKDDYIYRCFLEMISSKELLRTREIRLVGLLNLFFSQLIEATGGDRFLEGSVNIQELYVKKAVEYMERNFSRQIKISDVSQYIGIDTKYLSFLFGEYLNRSTQQFLIGLRMDKAAGLMKNHTLSISDVARSVGYDDSLQFSKIFKKVKNMSPRVFRQQILHQKNDVL
jgi:AraC-like DNA-binding protein